MTEQDTAEAQQWVKPGAFDWVAFEKHLKQQPKKKAKTKFFPDPKSWWR